MGRQDGLQTHFQGGGFSEDMRVRTQLPTAWFMVSGYCHQIKPQPLRRSPNISTSRGGRLEEVIERAVKRDKRSGLGSSDDVSAVLGAFLVINWFSGCLQP